MGSMGRAWTPIERLDVQKVTQRARLDALQPLYDEWQRRLFALAEDTQRRVRQRTLDKLAIETGVLEQLYDIDWGLTLTLIAEGFTRDVIERAGGNVSDPTLETIKAQRESLAMVVEFVQQERRLSASLIKELHHAVTRTQLTYKARDMFGTEVELPLPHGVWKSQPNHVLQPDGATLEYCPPEHVASEIDNLTDWFEALPAAPEVHPIIKAAWLHHRFVQIHPFADGNGRVARALTTLVMERDRWAPIVVDRHHRSAYLLALNAANEGDLNPLVRLFIDLEAASLASELSNSVEATSSDMVRAFVEQLAWKDNEARVLGEQRQRLSMVGGALNEFVSQKAQELNRQLSSRRIAGVGAASETFAIDHNGGIPWGDFEQQLTSSASSAGHSAILDLVHGAQLRLWGRGAEYHFRVAAYRVDGSSGLMAVTAFGHVLATGDAFRFVYSEDMVALQRRLEHLREFLDRALAGMLGEAMKSF